MQAACKTTDVTGLAQSPLSLYLLSELSLSREGGRELGGGVGWLTGVQPPRVGQEIGELLWGNGRRSPGPTLDRTAWCPPIKPAENLLNVSSWMAPERGDDEAETLYLMLYFKSKRKILTFKRHLGTFRWSASSNHIRKDHFLMSCRLYKSG